MLQKYFWPPVKSLSTEIFCSNKILTLLHSRADSRLMQLMQIHLSEKITNAFLPHIMRNNTFCENTKLVLHKFQQSYFFLVMSTQHITKFTSERFVLPKTCPSTVTLTFPPLM